MPSRRSDWSIVVAATNGSATKKLIVRAVGPALENFGVANPLRRPVLRIYDSTGRVYQEGYVYPAVVGAPTYDLADSLTRRSVANSLKSKCGIVRSFRCGRFFRTRNLREASG